MSKWNILFQQPRRIKFWLLSNNKNIAGKARHNQPVLLIGKGKISFGKNIELGYFPSPFFYSGYIHLESRTANSSIEIGDNVFINNNFFAVSAGAGISIGNNTLVGVNCEIIDSDFHELAKDKRKEGMPSSQKVSLGNNVFLGNNVKITKGVVLGNNVVVANGSVVIGSFEDDVIIGGVPAKIIGRL